MESFFWMSTLVQNRFASMESFVGVAARPRPRRSPRRFRPGMRWERRCRTAGGFYAPRRPRNARYGPGRWPPGRDRPSAQATRKPTQATRERPASGLWTGQSWAKLPGNVPARPNQVPPKRPGSHAAPPLGLPAPAARRAPQNRPRPQGRPPPRDFAAFGRGYPETRRGPLPRPVAGRYGTARGAGTLPSHPARRPRLPPL